MSTARSRAKRGALILLVVQGISHVTTQLALFRELLCVFSGNELTLGVLLASWLMLMGLGAMVFGLVRGGPGFRAVLVGTSLGLAILPIVTLVLLRTEGHRLVPPGVGLDLSQTILLTLLVLGPYDILAGCALGFFAKALADEPRPQGVVGAVVVADGIGDVLGGLLFGAVMVWLDGHVRLLCLVGLLVAVTTLWFSGRVLRSRGAIVASLLTMTTLVVGTYIPLDELTLARVYPGRRILEHGHSLYGSWVVTETSRQVDILYNGVVLASTGDVEQKEELAHLSMAQRPGARRVLVVGGLSGGVAKELLRYPLERLETAQLDPLGQRLTRRYGMLHEEPRLVEHSVDGRRFVETTPSRYDILVVDLPEPTTLGLNRFYTVEFFRAARRLLGHEGVLVLSLSAYANTVSPELARILATGRSTARQVFANTLLLPTDRVMLLASNKELTTNLADSLDRMGLQRQWVTRPLLDSLLTTDRLVALEHVAQMKAKPNRDAEPTLFLASIQRWLRSVDATSAPVWMWCALGLVLWLVVRGPLPTTIFAFGATASGLQLLLLLALQWTVGAVYGSLALVVTAYLAGSLVGSFWAGRRRFKNNRLVLSMVGLGLLGLSLGAVGLQAQATILCSSVLLGVLTGSALPLTAGLLVGDVPRVVTRLYAADLVGAALGAALTGTFLVPNLGVKPTTWVLAASCLLGVLVLWLPRKTIRWRRA